MLTYSVPGKIVETTDRHDERFFNRVDMEVSMELSKLPDTQPYLLGNILESIGTGKGIPKEEQGFGEIAFLKVGNVARYVIDFNGVEVVSDEVREKNRMELLRKGDILVSRVGTVGNVCMYNDEQPATPSDNVLVLRLKELENVRPFYVCIFLNSTHGQCQIRRYSKQSLQEVVNQTSMKSLVIPIPRVDVQEQIENTVLGNLAEIRRLRSLIDEQMAHSASIVGRTLCLSDGSDYKNLDVQELMGALEEIRNIAYKNSSKYNCEKSVKKS